MNDELKQHLIETIDAMDDDADFSELHYHAFNENYYIIGHYNAKEWLKKHGIDAFDAIGEVFQYEQDNFGEVTTPITAETIVNMYVYIKGEELINSLDIDLDTCTKEELLEALS